MTTPMSLLCAALYTSCVEEVFVCISAVIDLATELLKRAHRLRHWW